MTITPRIVWIVWMVWLALLPAMAKAQSGVPANRSSPAAQQPPGTIEITHGGVYTGNWTSGDAKVPAVTIHTKEPVTIRNSTVTGRGDLIRIEGGDLTVENVTGRAIDPGVKGLTRGAFVVASQFTSLVVKNCTMDGTTFGVEAVGATPQRLEIENNLASNLEDRASDGAGGFLPTRPKLGHFVILDNVVAQNGAEIAWNQVTETMGTTSNEDVINIYESEGSKAHPIVVDHNYMEGASTAIPGKSYTGTALITDGSGTANAAPTAYVLFENNLIVKTAGAGIGLAYGHDVAARNNRVVSCGEDSTGKRYAWGASAVVIWNYYKTPHFFNNTITGTTGGMVGPGPNGKMVALNEYFPKTGPTDPSDKIEGDNFTNPCLVGGAVNVKAEEAERERWAAEVRRRMSRSATSIWRSGEGAGSRE